MPCSILVILDILATGHLLLHLNGCCLAGLPFQRKARRRKTLNSNHLPHKRSFSCYGQIAEEPAVPPPRQWADDNDLHLNGQRSWRGHSMLRSQQTYWYAAVCSVAACFKPGSPRTKGNWPTTTCLPLWAQETQGRYPWQTRFISPETMKNKSYAHARAVWRNCVSAAGQATRTTRSILICGLNSVLNSSVKT